VTKVFKFGGASLKDVDGIRNIGTILQRYQKENLIVVVSAMGKTTNALEEVVHAYFREDGTAHVVLEEIKQKHYETIALLFDPSGLITSTNITEIVANLSESVNDTFVEVDWILEDEPHDNFDYIYDQIIGIGELVCSRIVAAYLNVIGLKTAWVDARDIITTDETWRESIVQWDETKLKAKNAILPLLKNGFVLTQGFIGSTKDNDTTTLGREGSDYSASILSNCVDAEGMYIWKDVVGVLNGDPRIFPNRIKLDDISYSEAIEMTYYGATVVHPRTIQPLMAKNIPLYVKSFLQPEAEGTLVSNKVVNHYPPIMMIERNQVFLKIATKDLSFLLESHVRDLYGIFSEFHIFVNLLQNSGAHYFASITKAPEKQIELLSALKKVFNIELVEGLDLITIRHPDSDAVLAAKKGHTVYYERSVPDTYQVLID
jgi:aspartate kinase